MNYSSKDAKIIGNEISELEKQILSLAKEGGSPSLMLLPKNQMDFKTRELLFPNH